MNRATAILFGACCLALVPAAQAAGPLAQWKETAIDAKDVELGKVIEHDFVLKNTGDAPLQILEVHNSCGCTVVDYPKSIQPGQEGHFKTRVKTEGLQTGRQSKTMTVNTDAPNAERVVLQVKFNLITALEFIPKGTIYLACVSGTEKVDQILARPHRPGLTITQVSSSSPNFEVRFEPVKPEVVETTLNNPRLPKTGDYWIHVRIPPNAPVGQHKAKITVKTTDPSFPEGNIAAVAAVRAATGS